MTDIEKMAREIAQEWEVSDKALIADINAEVAKAMEQVALDVAKAVARRCAEIAATHNTTSTYRMRDELAAAIREEFGLEEKQ